MKEGDFVYCLGEGDDIFIIKVISNDAAWLESFAGSIGWKNLRGLTKVKPKELKTRINKLAGEITFLTC